MYSRRIIFPNKSFAHVYYRCHDRNLFLTPTAIKDLLLSLLARYKHRYRIKIFEFVIMDNHVHLFIWGQMHTQLETSCAL